MRCADRYPERTVTLAGRSAAFDVESRRGSRRERYAHAADCPSRNRQNRGSVSRNAVRKNWREELADRLDQDTALPLESKFDAAGWGPWSEKGGVLYAHAPSWALSRVIALRLHLDASTSENGPLRVIPDSHRAGILSDDEVLKQANESESEVCPVGRGGVLAMRPLLIHSSSKAVLGNPRRVLHIEYADSLELSPGVRLAIA